FTVAADEALLARSRSLSPFASTWRRVSHSRRSSFRCSRSSAADRARRRSSPFHPDAIRGLLLDQESDRTRRGKRTGGSSQHDPPSVKDRNAPRCAGRQTEIRAADSTASRPLGHRHCGYGQVVDTILTFSTFSVGALAADAGGFCSARDGCSTVPVI